MFERIPKIRLLALDLDGTLFGDDLEIAARTRGAIADAQHLGVVVTIATGRMFRSARVIACDLGIDGPIICYQGAHVQGVSAGEPLLHSTVPHALTHEVIAEAEKQGLHVNLYLGDELFVARRNRHADFYRSINLGLPVTEVGNLAGWLATVYPREATKLVIVTDPERTDSVLAEFRQLFGGDLQVTKSHARFTEFTNRDSSKGRALAFLAGSYGIPREAVMAIGDGLNDRDMIEWAGTGVAMGGSPDEVCRAASVVCPPLAEHGAAWAIEEFVLGSTRR